MPQQSHGTAGVVRFCLLALFFWLVWLATQNHSTLVTETTAVPFLPVNPEYSSTRNQASGSIGKVAKNAVWRMTDVTVLSTLHMHGNRHFENC